MANTMNNIETFTETPIIRNLTRDNRAKRLGKVAVLFGGRSAEREVSLQSGENILASLLRQGVDAHGIDPDEQLAYSLREGQFDRAFIALHGKEGEDGHVQGLLHMLSIPYTGSGVAASALAMDKFRAKLVMKAHQVPVPSFGVTKKLGQAIKMAKKIGFPVAVKPVAEGSSLGVTRVAKLQELASAFAKAAQYGDVMIEKWIHGKDLFVSIIGKRVLPSVEVCASSGFYDYQAKYISDATQYYCPARITLAKEETLRALAYRAFCALGCEGWARVDVVQESSGKFWVLEVNTIPGMTSHSLVPRSAQAVGMNFDELVMTILEATLKLEHSEKLVGEIA